MCRNIRVLFNYEPPSSEAEIKAAAEQYVRKISGFAKPSAANEESFSGAVQEISRASFILLDSLVTNSAPRNREAETAKKHRLAEIRFGKKE